MVRASQRTGAGPSKDILNSDDSVASARPYGEAVQSNDLRVFAARSRRKNSVGLNAGGAEGSASASFSLWIFQSGLTPWRRPRWASRGLCPASSLPLRHWRGLARGRLPAFSRSRGARLDAPGNMCSRHARGMRGRPGYLCREVGLAGHGPWACFGESWRTNRRRPAPQQGQTRGSSGCSGSADGSAASALIWARSGVA